MSVVKEETQSPPLPMFVSLQEAQQAIEKFNGSKSFEVQSGVTYVSIVDVLWKFLGLPNRKAGVDEWEKFSFYCGTWSRENSWRQIRFIQRPSGAANIVVKAEQSIIPLCWCDEYHKTNLRDLAKEQGLVWLVQDLVHSVSLNTKDAHSSTSTSTSRRRHPPEYYYDSKNDPEWEQEDVVIEDEEWESDKVEDYKNPTNKRRVEKKKNAKMKESKKRHCIRNKEGMFISPMSLVNDDDVTATTTIGTRSQVSGHQSPKNVSSRDIKYKTSCHRCKTSQLASGLIFCSKENDYKTTGKYNCRKKFCAKCLQISLDSFSQTERVNWICPSCSGTCGCAICQRQEAKHKDSLPKWQLPCPVDVFASSSSFSSSSTGDIIPLGLPFDFGDSILEPLALPLLLPSSSSSSSPSQSPPLLLPLLSLDHDPEPLVTTPRHCQTGGESKQGLGQMPKKITYKACQGCKNVKMACNEKKPCLRCIIKNIPCEYREHCKRGRPRIRGL